MTTPNNVMQELFGIHNEYIAAVIETLLGRPMGKAHEEMLAKNDPDEIGYYTALLYVARVVAALRESAENLQGGDSDDHGDPQGG